MGENFTVGTKRPFATSCWRFAFRFHMEECKAHGGFMLQVEETEGLGNGQKIETEMAKEVSIKIFRAYAHDSDVYDYRMEVVAKRVRAWYKSGCKNMDLENIYFRPDHYQDQKTRPDFEPD